MPAARRHGWPLVVPPGKIRYLLEHETKAGLFRSLGFDSDRAAVLEHALLEHGSLHPPSEVIADQYGLRFFVVGRLTCPGGTAPHMRSCWIKLYGNTYAHLITAIPQRLGYADRYPNDG